MLSMAYHQFGYGASQWPTYRGLVVNLVVALMASGLAFLIKRYVDYWSIRRRTNIPFAPLVNPISGSASLFFFQPEKSMREITTELKKEHSILGIMVGPVAYICCDDADLYQRVFITDARKHINRVNLGIPLDSIEQSLLEAHDANWYRSRAAIGSIMNKSSLVRHHVDVDVREIINKFMVSLERRLAKSPDNVIDNGTSLFRTYTMASILTIGFNTPDEIDFDREHNELIDLFVASTKQLYTPYARATLYLPSIKRLLVWLGRYLVEYSPLQRYVKKKVLQILSKTMKQLSDMKQPANEAPNGTKESTRFRFIHSMVDLYSKKKLTKDEIVGNTFFLILAGYETSADTLTTMMWFLARYQQCQERLHEDIVKHGQESVYLDWCIKETLRLYPPARTGRLIGEDFEHNGYKLLKGMFLALDPAALHYEPKYWGPDFELFRPERFEQMHTFHPAQYAPFGLGIRNCVGQQVAYFQMKLLSVTILLKYHICMTPTTPETKIRAAAGPTALFSNTLGEEVSLRVEPRQ